MNIRHASVIVLWSCAACMSRDSAPASVTASAALEEPEAKSELAREAPAAPAAAAPGGGGARNERARKLAKSGSKDKEDSFGMLGGNVAKQIGSVNIKNSRYALACGLFADLVALVAAVLIAYAFFG